MCSGRMVGMGFCATLCLAVFTCASAHAQGVLGVDPTGRSGNAPPPLLEEQPPPSPSLALPSPPSPPPERARNLPLPRIAVRGIKIIGSTVFSDEELAQVITLYLEQVKWQLTAEDLEELRLAVTQHYVKSGYVNSGAIIPDQTVTDGVITLQIIEGALSHLEVGGNKWFRTGYIRDRLTLGIQPPLNVKAVEQRLQLLQQDDRIRRLDAELRPGIKPGESVLRVQVEESLPYSLVLGVNNYQSPTVGAERGFVTLAHRSLTRQGDPLSITYGQSDGVNPQLDISYAFPLTARDTMLALQYRKNDFIVVEEPFTSLDVDSESEIYGVSIRHPVYRTLHQEFALTLTGEHLRNKTFLLGEPFSFSPGARHGKSIVTALRMSLEWTERTENQVIAARSRFSVGIDALGATDNRSGIADGQFFSWLGQFQWARRLALWDTQTIFRLDLQLTPNPLLSLEQIAVGGRYSVRGYRENQLVQDNGLIASLEARIPLLRAARWADWVELAPFVDVGRAWNTTSSGSEAETLASIGLGLRWAVTLTSPFLLTPQFEVYWGFPLRDVKTSGGDLQDKGVHLQLLVAAF